MAYGETKVYYDGSHYIAIPHTERKNRRRRKREDEEIAVVEKEGGSETQKATEPLTQQQTADYESQTEQCKFEPSEQSTVRTTTKKQLFEELYSKYINLRKSERQDMILKEMQPYFDNQEQAKEYVRWNMERKYRNLVCRRVRMTRKARLANFNHFCTFTYDDKKHTEESFRKKLKNKLSLLAYRQGWRYMGVWERSPEKQRLHFHGLFHIPDGTMPSELEIVRDYSKPNHKMQESIQCRYFTENFGRNDFKEINKRRLGESLAYLMKYIEKSGERIVYSKGMYQYFISDIMDDDVVSTIGQEDKKLLLFDDFECWDEGCFMGKVSEEIISQMRKTN